MSSFVRIEISNAKLDVAILHDDQAPYFQVPNIPAGWSEIHRRLQDLLKPGKVTFCENRFTRSLRSSNLYFLLTQIWAFLLDFQDGIYESKMPTLISLPLHESLR